MSCRVILASGEKVVALVLLTIDVYKRQQPIITQALLMASDLPVFVGVGGGLTTGKRLSLIHI